MALNAKTIREALKYEARNNLFEHGAAAAALNNLVDYGTDAELIRFAQLLNNVTQPAPVEDWENITSVPDSAELARRNID